jgi:DNA relaxase NicK
VGFHELGNSHKIWAETARFKTGEITGYISRLGFRIFFHIVKKGEEFKSKESKNNRFEVNFMFGNCPPLA